MQNTESLGSDVIVSLASILSMQRPCLLSNSIVLYRVVSVAYRRVFGVSVAQIQVPAVLPILHPLVDVCRSSSFGGAMIVIKLIVNEPPSFNAIE